MLLVRFWVDPGGEQFGVRVWERATGEVLRASGDTGVCFLLRWDGLIIFRIILSLKESER